MKPATARPSPSLPSPAESHLDVNLVCGSFEPGHPLLRQPAKVVGRPFVRVKAMNIERASSRPAWRISASVWSCLQRAESLCRRSLADMTTHNHLGAGKRVLVPWQTSRQSFQPGNRLYLLTRNTLTQYEKASDNAPTRTDLDNATSRRNSNDKLDGIANVGRFDWRE